jgi:hypothetical protein
LKKKKISYKKLKVRYFKIFVSEILLLGEGKVFNNKAILFSWLRIVKSYKLKLIKCKKYTCL